MLTKLPIHYKLQWHQFSFNSLSFLLLLFTSPFSCAIHAYHPLHKIYFSQKQQAEKLVRSLNLFPKDSINIATHDPSFVAPKMVEKSFRIPSLNYSGHSVEDLGHHLFRLTHSLWRVYIYIYIGTELGLRVREGKSISNFFLKLQVSIHLEEKCYVHNIFTTFSQQIVNGSLLLIVMSEQKTNLSCEFKLELITTYHMWFVVKMLWT